MLGGDGLSQQQQQLSCCSSQQTLLSTALNLSLPPQISALSLCPGKKHQASPPLWVTTFTLICVAEDTLSDPQFDNDVCLSEFILPFQMDRNVLLPALLSPSAVE